jgi:hypothetical protein
VFAEASRLSLPKPRACLCRSLAPVFAEASRLSFPLPHKVAAMSLTLDAAKNEGCCLLLKTPLLVFCGMLLVRQLKEVKAGSHGWDCIMLDRSSVPGCFLCIATRCMLFLLWFVHWFM